jgi:hypothetical protein
MGENHQPSARARVITPVLPRQKDVHGSFTSGKFALSHAK